MGKPDPCIGRSIAGKFVLESLIGSGAMGSVYLASHRTLEARVAVKIMHAEMAKDRTFAERFLREARAASRLDHPNVIRVLDYGTEPDGLSYLVMEYVDGVDLAEVMERQFPLSDARIVDLLGQTLSATAAAHAVGIVHRDLKPENVMVSTRYDDEGRTHELVKVCAKMVSDTNAGPRVETRAGTVFGTADFIAPERLLGKGENDARSDLYSVGVMLYELLAGKPPFQAENYIDVVVKHVSEDVTPPSSVRPGTTRKLEDVCLRALKKKRDERWGTAREMRAALRSAIGATEDTTFALLHAGYGASADTQPAFSAHVPRRASPDLETLRIQQEPSLSDAPASSSRRRHSLAIAFAVLAAVAVLALVMARGPDEDPVKPSSRAPAAAAAAPETSRPPPAVAPFEVSEPTTDVVKTEKPRVVTGRPARLASRSVATQEKSPEPEAVAPPSEPAAVAKPEPVPAAPPPPVAPRPTAIERAPAVVGLPPLDASKGGVTWKVSAVGGGATAGGVSRALSRAASTWSECYRAALRTRSRRVEGAGTLRVVTDDQGRVIDATLVGFELTDAARCIQRSAMGTTIPNADTGEAWSTLALTFKVND